MIRWRRVPLHRWSLLVNLLLVVATAVLAALLVTRPDPQVPRVSANAPGARALDRAGPALSGSVPGTMASMADVAWFIPKLDEARGDMPPAYQYGCEQNQDDPDAVRCDFADTASDFRVAMVGDSKILQWQSAIASLGRDNSWHVISYTKSNCGLHAGLQLNHGKPYRNCEEWNSQVMDRLLADPPDVVLVSNHVNTALADTGQGGDGQTADGDEPDSATEEQQSTEAMTEGLTQQWSTLEQAGSDVIVILDNPSPIGSVYECLQGHLEDLGACAFPRSEGIARSAQSVQLDAAEEVGTVDVVDLTESICPAPMCVPVIGNVLIYRQGSHLTDTYVRTLTEALGRQLVPLVAQRSNYPDTQTG